MDKKQMEALNKAAKTNKLEVLAQQSKVFGISLWEPKQTICEGQRCANTNANALPADADIRALAAPAMYYQNSQYGLQIVLKYDEKTWGYAHLMHDKDGDPIIDENDTYDVKDVVAVSDFAVLIDGVKTPIILKGHELTKAYAAS